MKDLVFRCGDCGARNIVGSEDEETGEIWHYDEAGEALAVEAHDPNDVLVDSRTVPFVGRLDDLLRRARVRVRQLGMAGYPEPAGAYSANAISFDRDRIVDELDASLALALSTEDDARVA